jgi:hypothetical protein
MANKTFSIEVTMEERWIDHFCSMLKYMEHCGDVGHSEIVSFYSDGDGDFRPKFEIGTDFNITNSRASLTRNVTTLYDAG